MQLKYGYRNAVKVKYVCILDHFAASVNIQSPSLNRSNLYDD
jgi:hypothetical protein